MAAKKLSAKAKKMCREEPTNGLGIFLEEAISHIWRPRNSSGGMLGGESRETRRRKCKAEAPKAISMAGGNQAVRRHGG
jgi:hypothetical protein